MTNGGGRTAFPDHNVTQDGLPWEFHCHGLGEFDFTSIGAGALPAVEAMARSESVRCILTMYLPRPKLPAFVAFMHEFAALRRVGELSRIAGVALEGPMLGSFGGTPERGVWPPTRQEWQSLAACGPLGLAYVVLSPDAWDRGSHLEPSLSAEHPSLEWVVHTLWDGGVRPALGHFHRHDPERSAAAVHHVLSLAHDRFPAPFSDAVLTDHLFNDMPVNCRYNWRTPHLREQRDRDVAELACHEWSLSNIRDRLGPVPATIIGAAHHGWLTTCINFDDEHVDIAIAARTVEMIGVPSVIAMTDRTDAALLGGQTLHREPGTSLWYQGSGIVAAGSSPIRAEMSGMRAAGLSGNVVWQCAVTTPARAMARRFGQPEPLSACRSGHSSAERIKTGF